MRCLSAPAQDLPLVLHWAVTAPSLRRHWSVRRNFHAPRIDQRLGARWALVGRSLTLWDAQLSHLRHHQIGSILRTDPRAVRSLMSDDHDRVLASASLDTRVEDEALLP